ncbi:MULTISPECIES: hypothetical protein [unclassified Crossiella]|uniref:hypothetical protein n=1 Tax=unclassified Crossiella TaxID=2620835 RepID=UPI001FFF2846|nr:MULTISPECIES: hypothetical protein [unclassified Crossiella]MCK2242614.1 hypothetical protein [Crossiella sp. S99.2]MCK2256491.1 hypothetical protein [Crossiella sp. S99.1]
MRLRAALLAVASVCALGLAVPGTASAAEGDFTYRYYEEGEIQSGALVDPPSGECVEIPEVADFEDVYAFRPHNKTRSTVTMFKESDCEGDAYYTLKPGGKATDRLKLRSVSFS